LSIKLFLIMQTKRENRQGRLVMLPPLEEFVPSDHRLRRLQRALDLRFVYEAVRGRYCQDNGRPSVDPEVVIRLFLLQAIEGIGHVRELMRQVQVNLAYRWFIGYELDEALPDHSTLSRALDRFGDEVFDDLFVRSIAQCRASGLIEGKVLHVDATTIRADLDANRVAKPDSSDRDARFGHFPGGRIQPGYKQHTVADGSKRVVLGLAITPANVSEHDEAVGLIDGAIGRLSAPPAVVCADGAYGSGENASQMETRGIRFVTPPQKTKTVAGERYYSIEQFTYEEAQDQFTCPAGKVLSYARTEKGRGRREYRARRSDCCNCPLKSQCTISDRRHLKVTGHHASLIRLRADSKTESFKLLYRSRAPVIEGIFAESKQWHGLSRAWRRGLSKMKVQCLLVAAVLNFKRLATMLWRYFGPTALWNGLGDVIVAIWRRLNATLPELAVSPPHS
jgi:transposase